MAILTKEETNKCLADIDIALSQMDALVYENEALKAELTHAQSFKAGAERYRRLRNIGCIFWTDLGTNKEVKHQVCEQAMDIVIDKAMKD